MTDDKRMACEDYNRFLVEARRLVGPDVTALRLHILLSVYTNEGCNQRTLLKELDMTSVTALSRNLADMSSLTSSKKPGPDLIELRFDSMNLRSKTVHLTVAGKAVVERLLSREGGQRGSREEPMIRQLLVGSVPGAENEPGNQANHGEQQDENHP